MHHRVDTALRRLRYSLVNDSYFDTLCVEVEPWVQPRILDQARGRRINLRPIGATRIGVSLDETVTLDDLADLITVFSLNEVLPFMLSEVGAQPEPAIPAALRRTSPSTRTGTSAVPVANCSCRAGSRSLMPSTRPSNEPVARKESRHGTVMTSVASEPSSEPIDSTEKSAHCPSGGVS